PSGDPEQAREAGASKGAWPKGEIREIRILQNTRFHPELAEGQDTQIPHPSQTYLLARPTCP
ncbi:MAG: hypothetical protein ACRD2L_07625, partial [Terriglobia bacterium]